MTSHSITRFLGVAGAAILTASAALSASAPAASADPCPDIEAVFARGSGESPGVGGVGQSFIDALRSRVGNRSLNVYPVNYPASTDFSAGMEFAATVVEGIRDAANHVQTTAANCPNTKIVLGGFSQGAAVAGFTTAAVVPEGVPAAFVPPPMPPEVANHVAAVVLFGKPSDQWLRDAGAPTVVLGPLYVPKTIDLCADGDTICNGAPLGGPTVAHASYGNNGMTGQAADFAAGRL
jgi:cutinase